MKDNEIIQALECCAIKHNCKECPYKVDRCKLLNGVLSDALDLINRQKAEIERLHKEVGYWEAETKEARADIDQSVAEAIKEFAERLCEDRLSNDPVVIAVKTELKMMQRNGG